MKTQIYILGIGILLTTSLANAQPDIDAKRDYNWVFGWWGGGNGGGKSVYNFDTHQISYILGTSPNSMAETNTSISDTVGNLLFYSNGFQVFDRTHQVMANGDSLNYPSDIFFNNYGVWGFPYRQSALILPHPLQDSTYWIFHTPITFLSIDGDFDLRSDLWYSIVDMRLNGGLGMVTRKNLPLIDSIGFTSPGLVACRHANGRDWWILQRKLRSQKIYSYLFDADGFHFVGMQEIGSPTRSFLGQTTFSPDGTKFAFSGSLLSIDSSRSGGFNLFDFDRCTGLLSNAIQMDNLAYGDSINHIYCGFSPNSRYLYLAYPDTVFQYDTENPDMLNQRIQVAVADPEIDTSGKNVFWPGFQLGADDKLYLGDGPSSYLNTIAHPNLEGIACEVKRQSLFLEISNHLSMPYFPNYRLGSLHGSGCDTLGFGAGVGVEQTWAKEKEIKVYPNPATNLVTLTWNVSKAGNGYVEIRDNMGRLVRKEQIDIEAGTHKMNTTAFNPGIYHVILYYDKSILSQKLMIKSE